MIIKNMFELAIDRDIKGVVKVGQDDEGNARQELEEYVVTRELQKHFATFFSNYKSSIVGNTDKMGAWLSGFFGSGKSHLLKILSYLLGNKLVDGRPTIDYFRGKITDSFVMADMELACSVPTDVILFNIDSKSSATGKGSKDAIVSVFLRVFNEMQGFCGEIPFVADLERQLTEKGLYDRFREIFLELNGNAWENERHLFDFVQDDVVDALVELDFMSEAAARTWCEKATGTYDITIEDFARMVKRYIDRKGRNHHVVFLVDEIGQYIGDDSRLMLNLQTVTEDLGVACKGKCWVIVTSQQDIDSVTKTRGNDFSKIQGRFDTRLSLSSANVDEVIRKRILLKNLIGRQTTATLYEEMETVIKNLILFNDGVEKKLYTGVDSFVEVYPFIPYQFNLVGAVLTSIRTHSTSGKHLADGERSMLALFKESAMVVMNEEPGALVPFNVFYDALEKWIDHNHAGVITRALANEYLNPEHSEDCFAVNVLKTLFMVKYVKEIKANVENITSLMVRNISDDRLELSARVKKALDQLIGQTLVQKSSDVYVFLTDEEQEINRMIEAQNVEQADVIAKVSSLIFDDLFDDKRYRYPSFGGRYQFGFNQLVDDRPAKNNQNYDITLRIVTPGGEYSGDDALLRMLTAQNCCVAVALPDDTAFMDELRSALKIEKYLRYDAGSAASKFDKIKEAKKLEARDHNRNARLYLDEALKRSEIYVNGDRLHGPVKEFSARVNEALRALIDKVYHKLSYITAAMDESAIRRLLSSTGGLISATEMNGDQNRHALNDMRDLIRSNSARHTRTSLKALMDRFTRAPYGFLEVDVQWLAAKLFKDGEISFTLNSEPITPVNKTADELYRLLTRKEYVEKLLSETVERPPERSIKAVREVMKELFRVSETADDLNVVMQHFRERATEYRAMLDRLEPYYERSRSYPGREVVAAGKRLLLDTLAIKGLSEFFATVFKDRDSYLDMAEDCERVRTFFGGDQKRFFDQSLALLDIYEQSRNYITDDDIAAAARDIRRVIDMKQPYGSIHQLPGLNDQFTTRYSCLLDAALEPVKAAIEDARARVLEELADKQCRESLEPRCLKSFEALKEKAEACNNVAVLHSITLEADTLKVNLLKQIAAEEAKRKEKDRPDIPAPKVPKTKTVSIRALNLGKTWQLKSEDDVRRYVRLLEEKLRAELEADTVINLEF